MPKVTPHANTLMAQVTWVPGLQIKHIDDDVAVQRYAEASIPIRQIVHDYFLTFMDLDLPIDRATLIRMMDAAESRYERETGKRRPEPIPLRTCRFKHDPVIYYMRLGGWVKIGWSSNITSRRADFNPQGVMALEFGTMEVERERHKQFIDNHEHGEWFRLDDHLGAWIVDRRSAFEETTGTTVEQWLETQRRAA